MSLDDNVQHNRKIDYDLLELETIMLREIADRPRKINMLLRKYETTTGASTEDHLRNLTITTDRIHDLVTFLEKEKENDKRRAETYNLLRVQINFVRGSLDECSSAKERNIICKVAFPLLRMQLNEFIILHELKYKPSQ